MSLIMPDPDEQAEEAQDPQQLRVTVSRAELSERALRQQYLFLQILIDALPDMIFVKDRNFRVTLVNRAFCEASGLSEDEILGKNVYELYPKDIADVFQAMDEEVFATGEINVNQEWFVAADGNRLRLETTKVPYLGQAGEVVGIMALARDITDSEQRDQERRVLVKQLQSALRELAAEREKLREANTKLTHISQRDGLTGVHNRRSFDERLLAEWNRCRREQTRLAVILVDIDHFKAFNDTYGHLPGDDCLRRVARLLEGSVHRAADFVARYGGEEFAIVLPGASPEDAEHIAESCRAGLFELDIPHEGAPEIGRVTLSAGVACMLPDAEHKAEELVQKADELLYLAKRTRNSVRS